MSDKSVISIKGITCSHCAKGIEQHLKQLGLTDAQVNFSSQSASFSLPDSLTIEKILGSLKKIGYEASSDSSKKIRFSALQLMTLFCCLLAAPLVAHELIELEILKNHLFQLALTVPIMLTGGVYFTKSALRSLRLGSPNMDVLIALGSWAAFFYSLSGTIFGLGHQYLFYETSASIVAIVLLGNFIEQKALLKTEKSVMDLQQLKPETVKIRSGDGSVIQISTEYIKTDDFIILAPGDRAPCDGIIVEGAAELDLSFLSGESVPKYVKNGEAVGCGSLMIGGSCVIRATQTGENSSLYRIIQDIQKSRAAKPELEKLADRITSYFVPVVLAICALTFFGNLMLSAGFSQSLLRAIAVLVVSCPCALGLATPTAVTVALGLASRSGILVRKASLFETMPQIEHFIFDKTGTLTDGQFVIEKFDLYQIDSNLAKSILYAIEESSNHPIAKCLREFCQGHNKIQLSEHNEKRGIGVVAKADNGDNYELSSRDIEFPYNLALRINDTIAVRIKLNDKLKSEAKNLIEQLQKTQVEIEILSGDRTDKTAEIADQLGIKKFSAQLLPEDKSRAVAKQALKTKVAFIGDGINDSAALASAQAGITFSDSSDLARHSADVVIVSGGLNKIIELIDLSRKTTQSIRQNLFWAFFYNILMIPVAALGYLSPMHAAFAMVLSDLIVVANSLRLKLWKANKKLT